MASREPSRSRSDAVQGVPPRQPNTGWETQRSVAHTSAVLSIQHTWHNATMAHPRKSRRQRATCGAAPGGHGDQDASAGLIDPRAFGLAKAAYAVGETLDLLSIGRTSLYAAVKRGDLKRVKFGKRTLFYATDLAAFLIRLRQSNEADAHRPGHAPGAFKPAVRES